MSTYVLIDDLDIMEQADAAFDEGRASLLDDPDDLMDESLFDDPEMDFDVDEDDMWGED